MRNRSVHGGRHELGQNFLTHQPTITKIVSLVAATHGPILEIGAGRGALTIPLSGLDRPLRAIDIDERLISRLRRQLPDIDIAQADALDEPFSRPVIVGNLPFHITTPLLRRLLNEAGWTDSIVLTQWEVARRRAGVGGSTMMTAQAAPWFTFELHGRVPAAGFSPRPGVDGGLLAIRRRSTPLIDARDTHRYQQFVKEIFTGRGRGLGGILRSRNSATASLVSEALRSARLPHDALPRDITPEQWAVLWERLDRARSHDRKATKRRRR